MLHILKEKINDSFFPFYIEAGYPTKIPILVKVNIDENSWIKDFKKRNPLVSAELKLQATDKARPINVNVKGIDYSLVYGDRALPAHYCFVSIDERLGLSREEWLVKLDRMSPYLNNSYLQTFTHI